jgi:hypothetical protein
MFGNPYYGGYRDQQQKYQPMPTQPMNVQNYMPMANVTNPVSLLGKVVDSIDVVKAMDIALDGSVSYFPLSDGSAIVTKQLQADGTSKTMIYKAIEGGAKDLPQYATMEEVKKEIDKIDLSDLEDIRDELTQIKKDIKNIKKNKE